MSKKYLYYFSEGNDAFGGDKVTMKNTLGGKGAGLAEMTAAGMPVPQGFTITTDACTQYYADGRQINDEITADIFEHLKGLEEITGKKFGDNTNPLLVSVRSGARQSMPGMMDTILNLGLNDEAVEGLAKKTGNARFAYDCYRRFVQMFADVVMMVPKSLFEVEIDKMKEAKGVKNDVDLTAEDLKELVGTFKKIYEENEGRPFPQDPRDQLIEAVKAVFRSWDNPRANVYRKMNEIPYEWGTAVNVQQMAFGNSGDRSGTGVAFTLGGIGEALGGYKGYGYAMIIELLSAVLQDGWYGKDLDGKDENGNIRPYHLGHFFIAIDTDHFMGEDVCRKKAGDILRAVRASQKAPGCERIYTAGEKEHEIRLARKAGVPINDSVQKEIIAIRDELGLNQYHFPFED